jgi:hypothetical protein
MDKKIETQLSNQIKSKLAKLFIEYDFKRSKSTFYTRALEDRIEFIHIHKFSFGPMFRIHIGIRFLCDPFDSIALNGLDSDSFRAGFDLSYTDDSISLELCAANIFKWYEKNGEVWFQKWRSLKMLMESKESPLSENVKEQYHNALMGRQNSEVYKQSLRLLGIKKR